MRGFLITVVLAVSLAGTAAWGLGFWKPTPADPGGGIPAGLGWIGVPDNSTQSRTTNEFKPSEKRLYKPQSFAKVPFNDVRPKAALAPDPIIIPGCRLSIIHKQTISCQQDGMLLFVGKRAPQGESARKLQSKNEVVEIDLGGEKKYITYQPWEKTMFVEPGEMVAMLDPSLAIAAEQKAERKIGEAKYQYQSAVKAAGEAHAQYERILRLEDIAGKRGVALEDKGMKKLAMERTAFDVLAKKEAIGLAESEKTEASIMRNRHIIRSGMKGVAMIKEIYRNRKEVVKSMEPIMELYDIEQLRAKGLIENQYLKQLDDLPHGRTPRVSVEPVYDQAPFHKLSGHRAEITSIAFTNHTPEPFLISGSKDGTVQIWTLQLSTAQGILDFKKTVRVVACSPKGAKHHLCVVGCDDGSLHLLDLSELKLRQHIALDKLVKWSSTDHHRSGGVTALAFSPDGQFFATGGEDHSIIIWEIVNDKATFKAIEKYVFDAKHGVTSPHEGSITALHFTPGAQLVSASRDKTVRVWNLYENGAELAQTIANRGGTVDYPGVSADGRYMIFDQGRNLQLLSITDGIMKSELSSPTAATSFQTLALFSPDSTLMLTAGAHDGRLQLWKRPEDGGRGIELRHWVTKENAPVTCAAFAAGTGRNGQGSFAASGCKNGRIYLWEVPTHKEVAQHSIPGQKLVRDATVGSSNQVGFGVDVRNPINEQYPHGKLRVGQTVTVVIEP